MRQRITFFQKPEDSVDPSLLKISNNAIETQALKAAREDRITFSFEELPQELYRVLKGSHELHIRWVAEEAYEGLGPLVSRMSPGLHAFYTPQRNNNGSDLLCPMLKKAFGDLDCISPKKSFTGLPIERFTQSAASQFYSQLSSINKLVEYIDHRLCKYAESTCHSRVSLLKSASTFDLDFDTISHALTITAFHKSQTWHHLGLTNQNIRERLEVGILSVQKPQEPEELSLGGFLTVVGEDTKPSATLFSFPSRHHEARQRFSAEFIHPTGLHPTIALEIVGSIPPMNDRACSLHAHLTLLRQTFADKYQLSDPLFLASKNLSAIHYITPSVNLEAPTYAVDLWGSSVLLELAPPSASSDIGEDQTWTAQIPLHLRYLMPNSGKQGQAETQLPYPVVFWACTADEGSKFPVNPFDKVNMGYDGLFGPKTMFYHLSPEAPNSSQENPQARLINSLQVPVLDLDGSWYVELGTAFVVLLGFGWVLWCLLRVLTREGYGLKTAQATGLKTGKKRQ